MFKKVLLAVWTFSLEKGYNLLLSKTTLDEKAIEVIDEIQISSFGISHLIKAEWRQLQTISLCIND